MLRWFLCLLALCVGSSAFAQPGYETRWLAAGDLHNWYGSYGSEREDGLANAQQYGWRWPGIYGFRDTQVSKGLWIGAQNVAGEDGETYDVRVVHVGPRVTGQDGFFPTRFDLYSRFPLPAVMVDGLPSFPLAAMTVDVVDPSLPADFAIVNEVNTLLGLTMHRRVLQFAHDPHDDYHITEYTFTNTGNTDADAEIERPNQTLEGVRVFRLARLAVARETRYVIGNPTGWGASTMYDARGDGVLPDPDGQDFRTQFAWLGLFYGAPYGNLGGPIAPPALPASNIAPGDTLGRLGASAFVGTVTLHADTSPSDPADDRRQPTMTWIESDGAFTSGNSPFIRERMAVEYALMEAETPDQRHAYAVEPTGLPGWLDPSVSPNLGTSGGFSTADSYGPYTLAPGESVRIVVAEAAGGLSREANLAIGAGYKASGYDDDALIEYAGDSMTKNEWVFTSRDSLFQTFRRALANQESGYAIPRAPNPPASFAVEAPRAGGVVLSWAPPADAGGLDHFEIFRAKGGVDSVYTRIGSASPGETAFLDNDIEVFGEYYYYIQSVGRAEDNDGTAGTPPGALRSSRYLTQTYHPTRPLAVSTEPVPQVEGVYLFPPFPNPVKGAVDVRFDLRQAGTVTAQVFDVRGAEVARLASGQEFGRGVHALRWDATQAAAGVYVVRVSTQGEIRTHRVVVVR